MAVANYHDQHRFYPPAYQTGTDGRPAHGWRVLLLPYLSEKNLYAEYDFSRRWDDPKNQRLATRMPRTFAFHGDHRPGLSTTNYLAVVGPETAWPTPAKLSSDDVTDGLSSTIVIVENRAGEIQWLEPRDLRFAEMSFTVNDTAGISSKYLDPAVTMLDGSVRRLHKDLSATILRALLTARGGEKLQEEADGWSLLPDGRQRQPAEP